MTQHPENLVGLKFEKYPSNICNPWSIPKVLILTPHEATSEWLYKNFSFLEEHHSPVFEQYLRIEQDYGARELSISLANNLSKLGFDVTVLRTLYNRGLIDGGRSADWALRSITKDICTEKQQNTLLQLHANTVSQVKEHCVITDADGGFIVDLHTMAPFDPSFQTPGIEHPNLTQLEDYIDAFVNTDQTNLRPIDILTSDENGNYVTDQPLAELAYNKYIEKSYKIEFNKPYENNSNYMMNAYMKIARGIAIDFPKHLIAMDGLNDFNLARFEIDPSKVNDITEILASAIYDRYNMQ